MAEWSLPGPDEAILTKPQVVAYIQIGSARALDRLIESGQFPRGRRLGTGRNARLIWTALDVAAWLHLHGRMEPGALEENGEDAD